MGQKTNPISLRLQNVNRNFDSSWYSDYFYAKCFSREVYLKNYFDTFLKLVKLPQARIVVNFGIQNIKLYPFFCIPKTSRVFLAKNLGVFQHLSKAWVSQNTSKNSIVIKDSALSKNKIGRITSLNDSLFLNSTSFSSENKVNNLDNFSLLNNKRKFLQTESINSKTNRKLNFLEDLSIRLLLNTKPINAIGNIKPNSGTSFKQVNELTNKQLLKTLLYKHYGYSSINDDVNYNVSMKNNTIKDIESNTKFNTTSISYINKSSVNNIDSSLYFMPTSEEIVNNVYQNSDKNLISSNFNLLNNNSDIISNDNSKLVLYNNKEYLVRKNFKYKNYMENFLSSQYNVDLQLIPFLSKQNWQSAGFIADEIVYFLERRVSFSRIKNRILKQASMQPYIRGIRITCSGRVGGKSKKAQRATQECVKYGETSLHVFDCKIDFASRNAYTSFGTVGIKVWICFK